jgi:RecB family exonuclease
VLDWLEVEAQRQPFHVIEVEKKITLDVGGLALRVRADRIDQVPGGKLLIDYKTGEVSTAGWDGPRPDQPQLPLYAAFGNTPDLVGAVFAQTRWPKDKMLFKGRLENARANLCETLKDKDPLLTEPYTAETVEQWREVLVNLSASFVRGEAQIDPHIYPKSCQYCELHGLCRIAESRAFDDSRDAAEEEESE